MKPSRSKLALAGLATVALAGALLAGTASAQEFTLRFQWGNIPLCTSGSPNRVANPSFRVSHVPEGTRFIRFRLTDLDVPSYNHGGGVVAWNGETAIVSGGLTLTFSSENNAFRS